MYLCDKSMTMKNTLLTFSFIFFICIGAKAQYFPGQFFNNVSRTYDTVGSSPCIIDSSLYIIRYGGVQTMAGDSSHQVRYLWDRFYKTDIIRRGPASTLIILRSNKIYQYFPALDSMVYISASISSPAIRDISVSESYIWAITNFNQIGKYDSSGWHIITLPNSYNPYHILARNDSTAYLADISSVSLYSPTGLGNVLSLGSSYYLHDWSLDTAQNLWMAVNNNLMKITPTGADTVYNSSSLAFLNSSDVFSRVAADNAGNIWASTVTNKIFKYDGHTWTAPTPTLSYSISAIAGDRFSDRVFIVGIDSVIMIHAGSIHTYHFGNMPYQHIKAAAPNQIATDQGIFTYSTYYYYATDLTPTSFRDSSTAPYANDVTCFVSNNYNSGTYVTGYGTHHGLFDIAGINNASLPDTNINYIYFSNGSYYIGTDKGLCIYNQIVYNTFDTTNSALPSDKITFITSDQSQYTNQQELWVGTDHGLALYTNGQWTRFDTSVIQVPDLYVTGILPSQYYYMSNDSTVWVTTLGSGLIKLHRDGRYTLLNTANGQLRDDSLYYIAQSPSCYYSGSIMMGTNSHGICSYFAYGDSFSNITQVYPYYGGDAVTLHQSLHFSQSSQNYTTQIALFTDQGIDFIGMCAIEGIEHIKNDQAIFWHQQNNSELSVRLPEGATGSPEFLLYDMSGRQMTNISPDIQPDRNYILGISAITTGVYILETKQSGVVIRTKIAITK
ncbi:MAG: hypothetical protein JWO03_562 [Bacteroidetes bacterium]|nr:hypothetical protein [Bacteroidota bacterium]